MKKRYVVNLTVDERAALTQLVKRERVSVLAQRFEPPTPPVRGAMAAHAYMPSCAGMAG
jgi:hypothetical protein